MDTKANKPKRSKEWGDKISKAKKGNSPCWCKGLTKETDERVARISKKLSESKKGTMLGEKNFNWKGGIKKKDGYTFNKVPEHPHCDCQGYVNEHRLNMEKHIGRYMKKEEIIHHINLRRKDNRINNLVLCSGRKQHRSIHDSLSVVIADLIDEGIIVFNMLTGEYVRQVN